MKTPENQDGIQKDMGMAEKSDGPVSQFTVSENNDDGTDKEFLKQIIFKKCFPFSVSKCSLIFDFFLNPWYFYRIFNFQEAKKKKKAKKEKAPKKLEEGTAVAVFIDADDDPGAFGVEIRILELSELFIPGCKEEGCCSRSIGFCG